MANSRHISETVKQAVREREDGRCRLCGRVSEYMEFDHITPHRYGAPATVDNIQLLCRACNIKKRDKADTCPTCLARNPLKPKEAWIPHDAVVCHRCNTQIARAFVGHEDPVRHERSRFLTKLRRMSVARKLLFVLACGLLVFSLSSLAVTFVSGLWNSLSGRIFNTKKQTTDLGASCSIVDASGRANIKIKCDTLDCDNDPSTVSGRVTAGTTVTKTGNTVASSLPTVGEWTEISLNGQTVYVASTKLSCR